MNLAVGSKYVGIFVVLIGTAMLMSLPWAFPQCGVAVEVEWVGILALCGSSAVALMAGLALLFYGRVLTLLMLLGRLELFAILVLFTPSFWHKV